MENSFRLASSSVSDRGLSEKRPVNEDSFLELQELGLFAVADGVGGAQAGDVASQMAMEILSEAFANRPQSTDAEDVMRLAIESANQAIHQMSNEIPQLASMATTIAAIHLNDNIATVAHVGDSRVYRILPDGSIRRETADHSVVEEEVRAGRMTAEQALVHPSRNVISRALGADSTVDVELKTIMIESATMFLLCSDGITRHISDSELEELFNHEIEPDVLVQQMREICYSRGAEDNLTAVVVRVIADLADVSTNGAGTSPALDSEEATVATARSPFDSFAEETPYEVDEEYSTIDVTKEDIELAKASLDDDSYLLSEPENTLPAHPEETGSLGSNQDREPTATHATPPVRSSRLERSSYDFQTFEEDKPSSLSKLFSSLLFLVLGLAIGAGGYYFLQQSFPAAEVPVLNETKSNNIPLTSFEEGRRIVDSDPNRYLLANAASPETAEDHYLLGRAQLLTGKYVEATRQFNLAKERLSGVDPANAKTLAAEVALGQAIASNPTAAEAFAKEINPSGQTAANASSTNSNVQVR